MGLVNTENAPVPERWGVNELMRCLFVVICGTEQGKLCIRKDVYSKVPDHFINALGVKDCGRFYLLQLAKEAHSSIIIPKGGIWTPS